MTWQSIDHLNLLWMLPAVAALFLFAAHRRRILLHRLAHPTRQAILAQTAPGHARLTAAILLILTLAAMAIALARPAWNKTTQPFQARGRDVVFVLDISRSMLAAHRGTTRLEEAKFAIQECLQSIRGDRVALVIFAGNAKVACPLTHDTAFFLSRLNDVDHRSVTFGGTMLGDAIRLVCNAVFKGTSDLYRDVIVITDGEDMQSNPIQAAEQLAAYNARLIAVGMGDATPTPLVIQNPDGTTEAITDNGKPVMTRLDADTLRKMTAATPGGLLIPVPSDTLLNLNDIYARYIQLQEKKDFGTRSIVTYEEKFQLFALLAAALLLTARLLPRRRRRPAPQTLALLAVLLCLQPALAQSTAPSIPPAEPPANTAPQPIAPDDLIRQASQLLQQNQPQQAEKLLEQALAIAPDNPYANFNRAVAHFRQDRLTDALAAFQRTLQLAQAQPKPDPTLILNARLAIAETAHQLAKTQNDTPEHLEQALQNARLAVDSFQDALHDNPQRRQTKADLETAKLNFKTLRQRQKQLQQQQQQHSDQQKQQDKKNDDQQQQQPQQSQKQQDQQNDAQKQQEQQNDDQKQQEQQSDAQKQQEQQNDDQKQQDQQNGNQQALKNLEQQQRQAAKDLQNQQKSDGELKQQQQQLEQQTQQTLKQQPDNPFLRQSLAKQQEAQQKLDQNDRQQAQKAQKEAADLTRMAQRQPPKQPEQPPQPEPPTQPDEQPPKPEQPQPLQDARSLDAINQENLNRQNRRQHRFSVPGPRAQDW